jgi:CRP-like cAMP-binding protein
MEICKQIQYEFMEPGDVVFKAGDQGDKFYIVLKGRC